MSNGHATERKSSLERLLALFGDVRAGEGITAVLMFLNIFLILFAYYILKPVREGLILSGTTFGIEGDELKAYLAAVQALLLLAVVPAYGALASRVGRVALINTCMIFVIASLVVFFLLGQLGVDLGVAFYLWIGIVNVFLIAQFWSYANDIYSEGAGKRLFAFIAVGQSLGAILGSRLVARFEEYLFGLMLVAAALFVMCVVLYNAINRRAGATGDDSGSVERRSEPAGDQPLSKEGGFRLVVGTRYLLLIALMILVTNLVNTTGEYILGNAARDYAQEQVPETAVADVAPEQRADALERERSEAIGGFYGRFYSVVNAVGLGIQALLVSRIFKYLGVRVALFILPAIAFGGYLAIGALGGLLIIRIAKTAENATDYSLQNTVKQALFLPTSREAKYKAKAAIDTFFVRAGDTLSAVLVGVGIHALSFGRTEFAFVNVALVALWIALCAGIARQHRKLSREDAKLQPAS